MSFFAKRAKPKPESSAPPPDPNRNLFSHSGSFLTQQKERIERERQQAEKDKEREQMKNERKERNELVKRESPETKGEGLDRKPDLKRRRISSKESEKLLAKAGLPSGPIELESSDDDVEQFSPASQVWRSSRHTRSTTTDYGLSKPRSRLDHSTAAPVDVWEDDLRVTGSAAVQAPPSSDIDEEFSDPELAELSRKARRAARAQHAQEKKAPSTEANLAGEGQATDGHMETGLSTPELHDPIITIFITSDIPNTGSLLIRRKMSQPLGKVRIAWCERYKLSNPMRDEVFLAFCGRRQYDSTTCQRLGLKVDALGRPIREDGNADEPNDQVHVEAFTEVLFAERKAEKARQAKADSNGKYDIKEEKEAGPEPQRAEIKIIVKAKGKEDFKLKVSPHHSFAKISKVAKKAFAFASDQAVRLEFDGEPISPEQLVGDTEIEDMDIIDMYLES